MALFAVVLLPVALEGVSIPSCFIHGIFLSYKFNVLSFDSFNLYVFIHPVKYLLLFVNLFNDYIFIKLYSPHTYLTRSFKHHISS